MRYFGAAIVLGIFIHLISYMIYNIKQKNSIAAVGTAILAAAAVILPIYVLFFAAFEP